MQTSEPGLRERKRADTRLRLETAAVEFALRDGIEHTRLDSICEAADVSTRTFFNYFDSKEDAILGLRDREFGDDAVADALIGHDSTDAVALTVRLLFGILRPSVEASRLRQSRVKIVEANPQLLGRFAIQFLRMNEKLTRALQPMLAQLPQFRDESPEESAISAELVLSLCIGAARTLLKEWMTSGYAAPIDAVEQRAIELVKKTVERLR